MRSKASLMVMAAMLLVTGAAPVFADAFLRAWATSGNEFPVRLWVQGLRAGFPADTTSTVRFTVQNPLPPQRFVLQAQATYTRADGQLETTYSNPVTIEVDLTARNCIVGFYVVNGFIVGRSLSIGGMDLWLPYDAQLVLIPIDELPAGCLLRGEFRLFAR